MNTEVVNINEQPCDVYCGRPSLWGNPHIIGNGITRKVAIDRYRNTFSDMMKDDFYIKEIEKLRGKKIGCYCKPKSCHLDIIADYLNKNILDFE